MTQTLAAEDFSDCRSTVDGMTCDWDLEMLGIWDVFLNERAI